MVEDGKITAVHSGRNVSTAIPTMDVGGRVLLPGWVTARAFPNDWMGDLKYQVQNDENTEPLTPEMRARFAFDPWFPSFRVIREIGITTQNITPGHLNLIGGSGVVIKTAGMDVDKMVRKEPSCLVFSLTRRAVRYWRKDSQITVGLQTAVEMLRNTLDRAKQYLERRSIAAYDQRFEALIPALRGEVPVIVQAHEVDEIEAAIKLAEDYDLHLIIAGGVQAYKLAAELARVKASVILGNSGSNIAEYESIRGGGREYNELSPVILTRAGVKVSFFGASGSRRVMPTGRIGGEPALNAAWAFRNGATEHEALRMVTLNAAEMLDMGDRLGSLDVGKDADFMLLEGHPFDYRVLPQMVFIDGKVVYKK